MVKKSTVLYVKIRMEFIWRGQGVATTNKTVAHEKMCIRVWACIRTYGQLAMKREQKGDNDPL